MQAAESFRIALESISGNRSRAALTALGVVFGVAAVVAMVSIGEGARLETVRQIELLGANNIIVNRKNDENADQKISSPGLTIEDAEAIKRVNPYAQSVTPSRVERIVTSYKSSVETFAVVGTTPDYPETFNSKVALGSFFKSFHMDASSNVCVLGAGVADKLFPFEGSLDKKIKIGDLWFGVVGVMARKAASGGAGAGMRDFNDDIYVPFSTMTDKIEIVDAETRRQREDYAYRQRTRVMIDKSSVDRLTVKVNNPDAIAEAAHLVKRTLERRHRGAKDYEVVLPEQLLAQKQKTQRIFNVVMGAIAGISLLVGGIGIMNIMLASILERTREIGVRRAVGATRGDVLSQFLLEATTISVAGGLAGVALGYVFTQLISSYAGWTTVVSVWAIVFAFVVSVATGVVFGYYPAKKAAEQNPIESLRYE